MVIPLRQSAFSTLAVGVLALALVSASGQSVDSQRDRRAVVDFGVLLRNVLLKSAQLSNVKANLTRTIVAAKTPAPTRRTTTTTTTPPPPPPPPPRRPRPIYRPLPWPGHGLPIYGHDYYHPGGRVFGYPPFDYDADYDDEPPQPATAATTTTTTTTTPRPTRARRPPPPPPPPPPPQRLPSPQSYYGYHKASPYDYDYDDYNGRPAAAASPPLPLPPPVAQSPRRRAPAAVARRPPQLSNNLIYQYAQSGDIYSNADPTDDQEAVAGVEANNAAPSAEAGEAQGASDVDSNGATNDAEQNQPQTTTTTTTTGDDEQQEYIGDGSVANASGGDLAQNNQAVVGAADQRDAQLRQYDDSDLARGNPTASGRFIIKYDEDTGQKGLANGGIDFESGSDVGSGANGALSFGDFHTDFTPPTGSAANAYYPPSKGLDEYARQQYYF